MRIAFFYSMVAILIVLAATTSSSAKKWPKSSLDQIIDDSITRACLEECRIEYRECLDEYQKWQCKTSLRRCVNRCLREEERRKN